MEEGKGRWAKDTKSTPCDCWGSPPFGQAQVAGIYTIDACHWRHSAAVCVSEGHLTAKTKGTVVKMSNKELLRVLEVSPEGQPRVADIYRGCSRSLAPLCSVLGYRQPAMSLIKRQ